MSLLMYDSSTPPTNPPKADIVAGYIGGDTPYVWSKADWNSQPARYRLPIWVRDNPESVLVYNEVEQAVAKLKEIGAPLGITVVWDAETAVNSNYSVAFTRGLYARYGCYLMTYGSFSYVYQNPGDRIWDAAWTGVPHISKIPRTEATQYVGDTQLGESWDLSLVKDDMIPFLWDTHKTGAGAWGDQIMASLLALRNGSAGHEVSVLQSVLNGVYLRKGDQLLKVDGQFGPLTKSRVMLEQTRQSITSDGIVGPVTWHKFLIG